MPELLLPSLSANVVTWIVLRLAFSSPALWSALGEPIWDTECRAGGREGLFRAIWKATKSEGWLWLERPLHRRTLSKVRVASGQGRVFLCGWLSGPSGLTQREETILCLFSLPECVLLDSNFMILLDYKLRKSNLHTGPHIIQVPFFEL